MDGCGLDRIPADHEQNGRNGSVDDSFGDRADDGVIRDADGVCALVAVAGHIAAFDGTVDEGLGSRILRIGELLRAAAKRKFEANHVAVHLDLGKAVLAAERGQLPAGTGFDLDVVNLDRAKGIVGDADIRGRRDRAVRTNCDGEDGRDGDIHLGRSRITVEGAVRGGRQADAGGTGAAGNVYRGRFGSGRADGETCHEADGEEQGYEFLHVLHSEFSFFVLLVLDGNMDDGPGNTKRCAGVRI